jgi:hypothetical protein
MSIPPVRFDSGWGGGGIIKRNWIIPLILVYFSSLFYSSKLYECVEKNEIKTRKHSLTLFPVISKGRRSIHQISSSVLKNNDHNPEASC